jgi:hypothetical protein
MKIGKLNLRHASVCVAMLSFSPTFSGLLATPASAGVFLSINVAPPPLPVYVQPIAPGPNFIWAPGYWAYDEEGYYWVPGTWVRAPQVGLLWTPGYWGWQDGFYVWHAGYWGPHVGFYGGINYGCGYTGSGYWGGHWDHGAFFYNTSVTRVNTTIIHNTYNTTVVNNNIQRVSFNGGNGGVAAKPTPEEMHAAQEHHFAATTLQVQHQHTASTNKAMFASVNHGSPKIAATPKANVFAAHGAVAAKASKATTPGHQTHLASAHTNLPGEQRPQVAHSAQTPQRPAGQPPRPKQDFKHAAAHQGSKPQRMASMHQQGHALAQRPHPQPPRKKPEHG